MRPVRSADSLATFKCRLSGNLGVSSSYNPKNLSCPVTGIALPSPLLPEFMGNPVTTLQISSLEAHRARTSSESRADVAVCSTQAV
jgi:hypothetical protein